MKLSDYVCRFISGLGVRHVFMLPGGGAMHLVDSLGHCSGLEFVCNLHEQAAAIAAEAYAKVTNNLGVALVTSGPGGTNAVTGVAGAWLDSTPCLFLSGQVKRSDLKRNSGVRQLGVQEIDIIPIVESITKYAITVMEPESIRYHLEKAVYLAKSGRPGPVWLDIPLDVQASEIEPEALPGFEIPPQQRSLDPAALRTAVAEVLEKFRQADRPILLAGNGTRLAGAQEEFLSAIALLDCPVQTTWCARDLMDDKDPRFAGRPGAIAGRGANFALQNCDFLLVIGSRLDFSITGYAPERLARAAIRAMVDIDEAEIAKLGAAIQIPICSDAREFLQELIAQADGQQPKDRSAWRTRCCEWNQRYPIVLPEHRRTEGPVSTYAFAETLASEITPSDIVVAGSSGTGIEIFHLAFPGRAGQRIFHTAALGAMGFGIPAAIGVCLGGGRRRTILVDGDGGFQLNIQELETVVRLGLPIKFFVINNNGYASIRATHNGYFGRRVACDPASGLTLPSLDRLAHAYGIRMVSVRSQADLRDGIRAALETDGPALCELYAAPEEVRGPRLATVQRPDGSMASRPLEDLWPFLDRNELRQNMLIPLLEQSEK
jgi:acetolactate synthase I/II/III large subunit